MQLGPFFKYLMKKNHQNEEDNDEIIDDSSRNRVVPSISEALGIV